VKSHISLRAYAMMAATALLLHAATAAAQDAPDAPPAEANDAATEAPDAAANTDAAAADAPAQPQPCPICDLHKRMHEAAPWLEWGADLRIRGIYDKNLFGLDDHAPANERVWQRYLGRVWSRITPLEKLSFNIGLVWEMYNFCRPRGSELPDIRDTNMDEVLFHRFNVEWRDAFGLPLRVKVGRQVLADLNNWMFLEGTPTDGERTGFFDAARFTYEIEPWKSTLDVVYIDQYSDSDHPLPPIINDRDRHLREHDERAVVLYLRNKSIENTQIDGYFIWRRTWADRGGVFAGQSGWDSDLSTLGGRVAGAVAEHWKYYGELAAQMGHKAGNDVRALGANSRLSYEFQDPLANEMHVGYEYRSGGKHPRQNFDILWGRCFHCINLYEGYLDTLENNAAMFTNLHRLNVGWSMKATDKLSLHGDYHLLLADNNQSDDLGPRFSKNGCNRGHLFAAMLGYQWSKHVAGHLIGEVFFPGDYYTDMSNDPALFLRYELAFRF